MVSILAIISCMIYTISLFSPYNSYWVTSLIKLILFGVVPLCYLSINKQNLKDILAAGDKKTLKIPAMLGVGCCVVIWLGYSLMYGFFESTQILAGL